MDNFFKKKRVNSWLKDRKEKSEFNIKTRGVDLEQKITCCWNVTVSVSSF